MLKRGLASTRKAFCTASPSRVHENSSRALGCASRCLILVGACVFACCSIGGACAVACAPRAAHVGYARSCFRPVGCGEGFGRNFAETCFEASDFHSRHPNASGFCYDFGSCRLPNASAELVLISACASFRTQSMRRGPVNALLYVMRLPMAPRSQSSVLCFHTVPAVHPFSFRCVWACAARPELQEQRAPQLRGPTPPRPKGKTCAQK